MNRVTSLAAVLLVIVFGSIGIMFVMDWLAESRTDPKVVAIDRVAARFSSYVAIQQAGVPIGNVVKDIRQQSALSSVPVLAMSRVQVESTKKAFVGRGLGIECILVFTDTENPYDAIRRVWVADASVVARYTVTEREQTMVFVIPEVVEGGDPFSF